jgi:hypothetical protein
MWKAFDVGATVSSSTSRARCSPRVLPVQRVAARELRGKRSRLPEGFPAVVHRDDLVVLP